MKREELLEWLDLFFEDCNKMTDRVKPQYPLAKVNFKKRSKRAHQEILALIKSVDKAKETTPIETKVQVTNEWIEEKAKIIYDYCKKWDLIDCKDFIRQLYEEMPAKRLTVDAKFVEKWRQQWANLKYGYNIKEMLIEAGLEVVGK